MPAPTRIVLPVTLLLAACGSPTTSPPPGAATRPPDAAAVRVFATGETRGHIKPCKCQEGHMGGLARRATYLAGAARAHDLRIDLGNAAAGAGETAALRLRTTLEALAGMGYTVFVPGELEAVLADTLQAEASRHAGLDVVTANLVREDGTRPFTPYAVRHLPDGRRIAIVGLTQRVRPLPAGWTFVPAREALERALDDVGDGVDAVIVASSLDVPDTRGVITGLPQVGLALSSSDATAPPEDTGFGLEDLDPAAQHVAVVANFSTYVRCVDLDGALRPSRTWRAWLGEDVPGLPGTAAVVRRHKESAISLRPDLVPEILRAKEESGFAGSAVCAECHEDDHEQWVASGHAHAMETLVRAGSARDPDCVPCHLVDVPEGGVPAGVNAAAGDALGVGCEACHGPRRQHVENAMQGILPPGGAPTWEPREVCTGCHRPPEVRTFDLAEAWRKITHGE